MKVTISATPVPTSPWTSAMVHSVQARLKDEVVDVGSYGSPSHAEQRVRHVRSVLRRSGARQGITRVLFPAWGSA